MINFADVTIGVLALQGDFERHRFRLGRLGVANREVRLPEDMDNLDGLIIPGGESTTMSLLLDRFGIRDKLRTFCGTKGIWGTCAGMIMLAAEVDDSRIKPLGVIDIGVARNAYGRQVFSFFTNLLVSLNGSSTSVPASFIRAPMVTRIGAGVEVLATYEGRPVLLRQNNIMVSSFHTELDDDLALTEFFLKHFISGK